jgi:APA family basic amino acid/polyamine antiporter
VWVGKAWIGYIPAAAILMCLAMIAPVAIDIVGQAARGHGAAAAFLGVYGLIGALIYIGYGRRRARVMGDPAGAAAEILTLGKGAS